MAHPVYTCPTCTHPEIPESNEEIVIEFEKILIRNQ